MERLKKLPILRGIFRISYNSPAENLQPESKATEDGETLFAPPGTYNRLLSFMESDEIGTNVYVGKFHFKRYLTLSIPTPNMILLYHKVRDGRNTYPDTVSSMSILNSDKVTHVIIAYSTTGVKEASQQNLDEAFTEIDKTIKSGKIFRRGENQNAL